MPYLAESGAHVTRAMDFMRRSYELIDEPLNLSSKGQQWFTRILAEHYHTAASANGLVLGATPWLSVLMCGAVAKTVVADASAVMLEMCESSVNARWGGRPRQNVSYLHSDWLSMPHAIRDLRLVVGDNSFSFLRYPTDWTCLRDALADRMADGAMLLCRVCSVPAGHRPLSSRDIIERAIHVPAPLNLTAIRAALLFAHWNPDTYAIRPEAALSTFERDRLQFEQILRGTPNPSENDLVSIEKYRGTDAAYYAPPLAEVIALFERRFHVRAVYFGPYEMSQYFPLIAASKRSPSARRTGSPGRASLDAGGHILKVRLGPGRSAGTFRRRC